MAGSSSSSRRRLARSEGQVLRVATYRRISTNEVNQPHSLEAQERSLGLYIETHPNMTHVADYSDQQTGTNNQRPGLEAMLNDASDGKFDVVLFYRLDRLARSVYGFMEITIKLDAVNVAVHSATEPFETMTPAGKLMAQMLASFAEFEHSILIDRILEAYETKASKGEWLGGRAPFGYANDRVNKSLVVLAEEAITVRRVFRSYLAGSGSNSIAEELNAAGITHRGGKKWSQVSVLRLLEGTVYSGNISHGGERFPGLHEAIVTLEDFAAAEAIRAERNTVGRSARPANGLTDYVLTGVIRCGNCGGSYVGANARGRNRTYRYYICNKQAKQTLPERCRNERIDADALESMAISAVINAYEKTDLFEMAVSMATADLPNETAEFELQASSMRAAIAKTEATLARYFEAFEEGALDAREMKTRVEVIEERHESQKEELARLLEQLSASAVGEATLIDLSAALTQVTRVLAANGGWKEKKRILGALVESVTVNRGRNIDVVLRVPTVRSEGPGEILPGGRGRPRKAVTHPKRKQSTPNSLVKNRSEQDRALKTSENPIEWTPVRTGSL